MDKINWSSDFYSDSFSLHFDNLLNYIDLVTRWNKVCSVIYSSTEILTFYYQHNY